MGALLIKVEEGIEEHPSWSGSADKKRQYGVQE
jgi:hypothetical protein